MKLRARLLLPVLLIVALVGSAPACSHNPKPDTSQLSAQGLHDYNATQFVKLVNDAQTAVITANKTGRLSDVAERQVLTLIQQVRDVVRENPPDLPSKVRSVIKNARQALPPAVDAVVADYLSKVIGYLNEVK